MTSIDAVSGDDLSIAPISDTGEAEASHEEAVSTYQDVGPNSGLKRMREEGAILQATAPHLQVEDAASLIVRHTDNLIELISRLEDGDAEDIDFDLMDLTRVLAPINLSRAEEITAKIKSSQWKVHALLEISKFQKEDEAKATLQVVKELCPNFYGFYKFSMYSPFGIQTIETSHVRILGAVLEEEKRRGFPEAEETLAALLRLDAERSEGEDNEQIYLIKLKEKYGIAGFLEDLQCFHEKLNSRSDPDHLVDLFRYQAKRELPEAIETREKLQQSILLNEDMEEGLESCRELLTIESQFPHLRLQFEEDFAWALKLGHILVTRFPEDREDYDFELLMIYKAALTIDRTRAQEVLSLISPGRQETAAVIGSMLCFPKQFEGSANEKEKALQVLHKQIGAIDSLENSFFLNFLMFDLILDEYGISRAQPYLDRVKEISGQFEDRFDRIMSLKEVLDLELKHKLPTFVQTLQSFNREFFSAEELDEQGFFKPKEGREKN